jgi:hypothetical protein
MQTRACFSIRPFWLRRKHKRAAYSLAQNRRGSLVKLAKVVGHRQYTDERIAAVCLDVIAAKGPPYAERISRKDHIREAKTSVGAQARSNYDASDQRFPYRSCA